MKRLSEETRKEIDRDPFYRQCCLTGKKPVQLHHWFKFGKGQVDKPFAILPLHKTIHDQAHAPELAERIEWVGLNRMTRGELLHYSKVRDLRKRRDELNFKFA